MPQTTYSRSRAAAVAGLVTEGSDLAFIVSYPANEDIPPGRLVVLRSDGKVELPQATTLSKPLGVSCFNQREQPAIPAAGFVYKSGDMVPVLRFGRIWASFSGGSPSAVTSAMVNHSSTISTNRGKFSASATAGTAGSEISAAGGAIFLGSTATSPSGLYEMEINYLGSTGKGSNSSPDASVLVSQSANDYAIPAARGTVYEINTTAANSTVSFPAAAPDGTVCYVMADGTKNGHTLTFRDVTTVISAATTASKRVGAVAFKNAGSWVVILTVGP